MISLAGNTKLCTTVQNFISEGRIPHAILIEGDYGTGKHTLAKYIATAIVCKGENAPCKACNECHLAEINSHPDITVIKAEDGKKNISITQIRTLRNDAFIKPHQAEKRIFIIDNADTLNEQAQNALLKVLEEPPKTVMFILIAENKASLLDTIISRCVTLTLNPPEFSVAFEHIKKTTDFTPALIEDALKSEKNNIGRALNLLNGKASSETEEAAKQFLALALNCDQYSMLKLVAPYSKNRVDAAKFVSDLKYLISQRIRKSPKSNTAKPLMTIYTVIPEFEDSLATNINLNLLFCNLTCKMTDIIRRNT
jgi:DNA polymerase-3 subunit delta'